MWADKVSSGKAPKAKFIEWIAGALFIDATCRQSEKRQTIPVGLEEADKKSKKQTSIKK